VDLLKREGPDKTRHVVPSAHPSFDSCLYSLSRSVDIPLKGCTEVHTGSHKELATVLDSSLTLLRIVDHILISDITRSSFSIAYIQVCINPPRPQKVEQSKCNTSRKEKARLDEERQGAGQGRKNELPSSQDDGLCAARFPSASCRAQEAQASGEVTHLLSHICTHTHMNAKHTLQAILITHTHTYTHKHTNHADMPY